MVILVRVKRTIYININVQITNFARGGGGVKTDISSKRGRGGITTKIQCFQLAVMLEYTDQYQNKVVRSIRTLVLREHVK